MKRKLIAIDLDGTTLNNAEQISDLTIKTIKKLSRLGHIVTIVTGRPSRSSVNFYDKLGLHSPMINFNGALGHIPYRYWKSEYEVTFSKKIALDILEMSQTLGIKIITAENKNSVLTYNPQKIYSKYFPTPIKESDFLTDKNLTSDPTSMTMFVDKNKLFSIAKTLDDHYAPFINVGVWGGSTPVLEISPKSITKAYGIKFLAKLYNIDRKDVISIGDEHNDKEMLEYSGIGVAMKNAAPNILKIADEITTLDNDQNGLAYYLIDKFNLKF